MFLFLIQTALAIPQQLSQQGRLLDAVGSPVQGTQNLTFSIYDGTVSNTPLWSETITVLFNNGFYATMIGTDTSNPLDSELLDIEPLYLELQINNDLPLQPRQKLGGVPYARRSDVATNVEGGVVNATEISINGNVVLDSSGVFTGQPITPQWSDIQGVPTGFRREFRSSFGISSVTGRSRRYTPEANNEGNNEEERRTPRRCH